MSEVRRMGFDNLRDAWRITDLNSNFEYVPLHYNCVTIFVMKARLISRLCSNGARSPEATNIWPRATENIFLVARPGDRLVLVS